MTIVAFLQCQWFPARHLATVERAYRLHGPTPEDRADLNARHLFFRCLTGSRLRAAFGEPLCDRITWENASPRIATEASGSFPPDHDHIRAVVRHFKPSVVLTFGRVADRGVHDATVGSVTWDRSAEFATVTGSHPAARHATVAAELGRMAAEVRRLLVTEDRPCVP